MSKSSADNDFPNGSRNILFLKLLLVIVFLNFFSKSLIFSFPNIDTYITASLF